jgi:hypothetical protein
MAAAGSWAGIREHGLLSTSALLDLYQVTEPRRSELEAAHRDEPVVLEHPTYGAAIVRDQRLMSDEMLARVLIGGMSIEAWYREMSSKVFFWPWEERLETYCGYYKETPHTLLVLDAKALLADYEDAIRLSHLASGQTRHKSHKRGPDTFQPIATYEFESRRSVLAEVAVEGGVRDIETYLIRVEEWQPGGERTALWAANA